MLTTHAQPIKISNPSTLTINLHLPPPNPFQISDSVDSGLIKLKPTSPATGLPSACFWIWVEGQAIAVKMMMATQKRNSKEFLLLKYEEEEGIHGSGGTAGNTACNTASGGSQEALDPKRLKRTATPGYSIRERKDKFGEKVAALQQLVSPFGKTDTASVLQEATGYIKFLHEQLEVLSAPYLQAPPAQAWLDLYQSSLRSRGLCLVPVVSSLQLAQSNNGADIWAPVNTVKR